MATAEELANGSKTRGRRAAKRNGDSSSRLADAFGVGAATTMEWDDVDPRYVAWVVTNVTRKGGAVTFGRSRDQGALMVTILFEGDRQTKWISPRDDAEVVLQTIAEVMDTL